MIAAHKEPTSFGRYRVLRVLGEGAMGTVYVAEDGMLRREVAIKAIQPMLLSGDAGDRFFNEARAIAALAHPNVVPVFDLGEQDGVPFLVMEIARGGSLRSRIKQEKRLPPDVVRALGIQIAHALAAAHARGILHRDVKPANILEGDPGVWKLADFGVARVPGDVRMTITGQFLGSPAYAAPESLRAGVFDATSDVYSLACTLFEAATGSGPHDDLSFAGRFGSADAATAIHENALAGVVPPELATAILRGLARSPTERPSASEFAALLAGIASPPSSKRAAAAAPIVAARPAAAAVLTGPASRASTPVVDTVHVADSVAPGVATVFVADSIIGAPPATSRRRGAVIGALLAAALAGAVYLATRSDRPQPAASTIPIDAERNHAFPTTETVSPANVPATRDRGDSPSKKAKKKHRDRDEHDDRHDEDDD